jgi:hypothetical protein
MTDVSQTAEKKEIRRALVDAALATLEQQGWAVAKVRGGGKGRVRRITKAGKSRLAVIRTTQDRYLAFPRAEDGAWITLSDVDVVVAASVDDAVDPHFALVHIFDGDEMRQRYDRAYKARIDAGHSIPDGRGLWLALYEEESNAPGRVGAGAGLVHPPIAKVPLNGVGRSGGRPSTDTPRKSADGAPDEYVPLTIAEAKARLARTLGVDPSAIKITVEA